MKLLPSPIQMSPATVCWTLACTMLLSLADAAPMSKMIGRSLDDLRTMGWPDYDILVSVKRPLTSTFAMQAKAVRNDAKTTVLYDIDARFLDDAKASNIDPSLVSYRQTDGYATMIHNRQQNPVECLPTESGSYLGMPSPNAIFKGLMGIRDYNSHPDDKVCKLRVPMHVDGKAYEVCQKREPGKGFMITSADVDLDVTYVHIQLIKTNGGKNTTCQQVATPFEIEDSVGLKLLLNLLV